MRVYNKSSRMYQHEHEGITYCLNPKTNIEVPDTVAKLWLKTGEVVEYVKPEEAKAAQAKLEEENKKLKAELEALKKNSTGRSKSENK